MKNIMKPYRLKIELYSRWFKSPVINLIYSILLIIIAGCTNPNTPIVGNDGSDCPLPTWGGGFGMGFIRPQCGLDQNQSVSYDLKKIAFVQNLGTRLKILDIQSGEVQSITLEDKLPNNMVLIGSGFPTWCPYDNNKLILNVVAGTDTNYDGKGFIYGQHLYMLTLDGKVFKNINPAVFPPEGGEINIRGWMNESTEDRDVILMGWGYYPPYPKKGIGGVSRYIPQEDKLEGDYQDFLLSSYDGTKTVTVQQRTGDPSTTIYALNRKELNYKIDTNELPVGVYSLHLNLGFSTFYNQFLILK